MQLSCGKSSLCKIIKFKERIRGIAEKRRSRGTRTIKDEVILKKYLGEE